MKDIVARHVNRERRKFFTLFSILKALKYVTQIERMKNKRMSIDTSYRWDQQIFLRNYETSGQFWNVLTHSFFFFLKKLIKTLFFLPSHSIIVSSKLLQHMNSSKFKKKNEETNSRLRVKLILNERKRRKKKIKKLKLFLRSSTYSRK